MRVPLTEDVKQFSPQLLPYAIAAGILRPLAPYTMNEDTPTGNSTILDEQLIAAVSSITPSPLAPPANIGLVTSRNTLPTTLSAGHSLSPAEWLVAYRIGTIRSHGRHPGVLDVLQPIGGSVCPPVEPRDANGRSRVVHVQGPIGKLLCCLMLGNQCSSLA